MLRCIACQRRGARGFPLARVGVGADIPEVAAPVQADRHREDDADEAEDRARHGKTGVLDQRAATSRPIAMP